MKKGLTYYESKKAKSICHRTTFYSIFNMSSCRKPEIQNDLPKITKIKWIWYFLWSKILCPLYHVLTTIQFNFKNIKNEIKKLRLQWYSNPHSLGFEATEHLRKENCRKRI